MGQPSEEGGELIECYRCGPLPESSFHKCKTTRSGYQPACKKCQNRNTKSWRHRKSAARKASKVENRSIILIGDAHFPFHHEGWYQWMLQVIRERNPGTVVQVGDLYDLFSFTKYPRTHNLMPPGEEVEEARACAEEMWKEIHSIVPDAQLVQLRGNHDMRIERRVIDHLPEVESLVRPTIEALWAFPHVKTVNDSREEYVTRGVLVHHGHRKFGAHLQYNNMSTATGHLHTGGLVFKQTLEGVIWELNVGCGINPDAPVFTYQSQKRLHGVTLGLGEIDSYGPRFIPYVERR